MKSFKSEDGVEWDVSLNIGKAKTIKSKLDIDLIADDIGTLATTVESQPLTRIEMLWIMVDDKGDRTQEDFDSCLGAGTFKAADAAFWDEFRNFIQSLDPMRGEALKQMVEKLKIASQNQVELMLELASSPQAVAAMEKAIKDIKAKAYQEMDGMISTGLLEPLESSPTS